MPAVGVTAPELGADDHQVAPAATTPCAACPWRTDNHGRRSMKVGGVQVGGWYTRKNLTRLWAGLRRGEMMTCHPTDPRNPVLPGKRPTPENTTTRECAGAHLLLQREVDIAQRVAATTEAGKGWGVYRRLRPRGLTRDGLLAYLHRMTFGGVPMLGGCEKPPRIDLNQPCSAGIATLPWPVTLEGEADA